MEELKKAIAKIEKETNWFSFDLFFINKMLCGKGTEITLATDELRLEAYHTFMGKIGVNRVASMQTIQRWFGIHGCSTPDRETLFKIAFALHWSPEEFQEVLVEGLGEPEVQINDYREFILFYGITNQLSYEDALRIMDDFIANISFDRVIDQHHDTDKLWKLFYEKSLLKEQDFLSWMIENAEYFKGYSKTTVEFLQLFKSEILTEIKSDAEIRLEQALSETGYSIWEQNNRNKKQNKKKALQKYMAQMEKEDHQISEPLQNYIFELEKMSEIQEDSNLELLLELYASITENRSLFAQKRKKAAGFSWSLLDNKALSELLNIGTQKERQWKLSVIRSKLMRCKPHKKCPKELLNEMIACGFPKREAVSVEEALDWVNPMLVRAGRRIKMIQRQDLLPLILTIAQLRYQKENVTGERYSKEEGQKRFRNLADTTLTACGMECFNRKKYKLDAILWNCYGLEEMYSVSDFFEIL